MYADLGTYMATLKSNDQYKLSRMNFAHTSQSFNIFFINYNSVPVFSYCTQERIVMLLLNSYYIDTYLLRQTNYR